MLSDWLPYRLLNHGCLLNEDVLINNYVQQTK